MSITETELLEELVKSLSNTGMEPDEGARTVLELAEHLDSPSQAIRSRLRALIKDDRVEVVKVPKRGMTGVVSKRLCYRLKNPTEEGSHEIQ